MKRKPNFEYDETLIKKGLLDEAVIEKEIKQDSENQNEQHIKQRQILKIKTKTTEQSDQKQEDKDTNDDKKQQNKQTFSLFGQNNIEKNEQKPTGLFANLNNQGSGLFANSNQPSGLFSNLLNNNNNGGGFFQNLDNNKPKLNFSSLFQNKENEDKEEEEEGEEVEPQSPEINPELSKGNYKYEEKQDRLVQISVSKFKVGDQETLEQGMISIEKDKEGGNTYVIYRSVLKRILYQGILIGKLINSKKVGTSGVSIQLNAYNKKEDKLDRSLVRIRFTKHEDCEELVKKLEQLQE